MAWAWTLTPSNHSCQAWSHPPRLNDFTASKDLLLLGAFSLLQSVDNIGHSLQRCSFWQGSTKTFKALPCIGDIFGLPGFKEKSQTCLIHHASGAPLCSATTT